ALERLVSETECVSSSPDVMTGAIDDDCRTTDRGAPLDAYAANVGRRPSAGQGLRRRLRRTQRQAGQKSSTRTHTDTHTSTHQGVSVPNSRCKDNEGAARRDSTFRGSLSPWASALP